MEELNATYAIWISAGFVVAAIVGAPLLTLIRSSVQRHMRERARTDAGEEPAAHPARADAPPLNLATASAPDRPQRPEGRELFARARRARVYATLLYLLAGVAAACVLAVAERGSVLHHVWPVVLTLFAVGVPSFRAKLIGLTLSAALIFLGVALAGDVKAWLMVAGPPTALLAVAANRWLKNIGPLMVICVMTAWLGLTSLLVPPVTLFVFGMGGLFVSALVYGYRRKFFSDLSFQLGFLWTIFAVWFVVQDARGLWWAPLPAIAVYVLTTRLTLPLLRRQARRHRPVSLLVLRAFGAPERSQRLFEELGTRWRFIGPLHLIAGVDSAVANLDLDEAALFLTFQVRALYVQDEADMERRLARLDTAPDPDGRYRINDFFCFEDTWKPTFTRLLAVSDVVLVDLSGFGPQHAGVAFELGQLLARRPLDSFVLVTNDRTDADHLSATLTRLWRELDPSLPNARVAHPLIRVFHNPRPRHLVAALCDAAAAAGGRVQSAA